MRATPRDTTSMGLVYDVFHYTHALAAGLSTFSTVQSLLPWSPRPSAAKLAAYVPLPGPLAHLKRRQPRTYDINEHRLGLGVSQLLNQVPNSVRRRTSSNLDETRLRIQAERAASIIRPGTDVVHAVDGLGYRLFNRTDIGFRILEKRNLHETTFADLLDQREPGQVESSPVGFRQRPQYDQELRTADLILTYSSVSANSYTALGIPSSKLRLMPLGTCESPSRPDDLGHKRPKQLLFIGRATAEKGIDIALESIRMLKGEYNLVVVGAASPAMATKINANAHAEYRGFVSKLTLRELARASAALICPSIESFGLAALDSAVWGLHLFCSPHMGLAEWLPQAAFTRVPSYSPDVWAEHISSLTVDHPAMDAQKQATLSIQISSALTWNRSQSVMESIYTQSLSADRL